MTKSNEIKQIARNKLAGNWPKAFAITAIFVAINLILSYGSNLIENVTTNTPILFYAAKIIFAIILLPVSFGYISSIIKLINGKNPEYTEIINDSILNSSKAVGIFFRILLKILVPAIITIIAAIAIFFLSTQYLPLSWDTLGGYLLLVVFLYIVSIVVIAIIALPYALSNYALANNNELSAKEAVEKSIALMDGNKWNFFKLLLSFIGWFLLLGIIVAIIQNYAPAVLEDLIQSVATIFLLPYVISSIAVFYDELNDVKVEVVDTNKKEETVENSEISKKMNEENVNNKNVEE